MEFYYVDVGGGKAVYYAIARKIDTTVSQFVDKIGFSGGGALLSSQLNAVNNTDTFAIDVDGPSFDAELKTALQIRDRKAELGPDYMIYKVKVGYSRRLALLQELKTTVIDSNDAEVTNTTLVSAGMKIAFFQGDLPSEFKRSFTVEEFDATPTFQPQLAMSVTEFSDLVVDDETRSTFSLAAECVTNKPGVTADYSPGRLDDVASTITFFVDEKLVVNMDESADLALAAIFGTDITHYE